MANGLKITLEEFDALPQKQKLTLLYQNTEELKRMLSGYKWQQRIQWTAITVILFLTGLTKLIGVL